jgi:energy-coupling factor transporter ATP-binding protein EcfA2
MIEWLDQNFPIGKNYLVCQDHKEQINSFIEARLVASFHAGRKHNLWGEIAARLPQIGKQVAWVPNKMPAIFLNETVEHEIADALAAAEAYLQPGDKHIETARKLLSQFDLLHLAQQNPFFLSEGETKMLWLLTQWVKKPVYLIIGYLPSGLSKQKIHSILSFIIEQKNRPDRNPAIILGYQPDQADWCANLISDKEWQIIPNWPE